MRIRTLLVLAATTLLLPTLPGYAQPADETAITEGTPAAAPPPKDWHEDAMLTPQGAVLAFVQNSAYGSAYDMAYFVAGAKRDSPIYSKLKGNFDRGLGEYRLKVEPQDIQVEVHGDTARATVTLNATHHLGMGIKWQEKLELHSERVFDKDEWRLVPHGPEALAQPAGTNGMLQQLVDLVANPEVLLARTRLHTAMVHMKAVALGALLYWQDHDETFALTPENFRERVSPYLGSVLIVTRDKNLFTAPGDGEVADDVIGPQDFQFNGKLTGTNLEKFEAASKTVMIYLGHDGQLEFPYEGQTVIGFADGHIEAVGEEAARKLRWEP